MSAVSSCEEMNEENETDDEIPNKYSYCERDGSLFVCKNMHAYIKLLPCLPTLSVVIQLCCCLSVYAAYY